MLRSDAALCVALIQSFVICEIDLACLPADGRQAEEAANFLR
jgi:hypothetical protein